MKIIIILYKCIFFTSCNFNLCKIFKPFVLLKGLHITISLKTVPENTIIFSSSSPVDVAEYLINLINRIHKQIIKEFKNINYVKV